MDKYWYDGNIDFGFLDGQAYEADLESPNDMLVDPDEYVTEQPDNEKDDVAIINPDQLGSDVEMQDKLQADDCESLLFVAYQCRHCADLLYSRGYERDRLPTTR